METKIIKITFVIQVTLEFVDSDTGVHNRIRSLYVRMLNHKPFIYCGQLWEMFINFLLKYRTKKQAKDVFYTALQCCPGNKVRIFDAVHHLFHIRSFSNKIMLVHVFIIKNSSNSVF